MAFKNTGTTRLPPVVIEEAPHADTPLEEYDHNCVFPIREFRTDKVIVTPLIPSLHARDYFEGVKSDEENIFRWVPWGPFKEYNEMLRFLEATRKDPSMVHFAVVDIASGKMAGILKLYQCDLSLLSAEIGNVLVLPPFRRTYVLTHALSLFFTWCFTPPTTPSTAALLNKGPGLGLRRVQWTSAPENDASIKGALRMGYKEEGVIRLRYAWPMTKAGPVFDAAGELPMRVEGETRGPVGRDAWLGSITKGEWEAEGGVRELVERQMKREL